MLETEDGFAILLDGRPVKTPAKSPVRVPQAALAQAIAAEWNAQEDEVDPTSMPFTRYANAAIDKVTHQRAEIVDMLAEYGGSDLVCYRADHPPALVARQAAAWDPLLNWADETFGARLKPTTGVMFVAQDGAALAKLKAPVAALTPWELTAFHDFVTISGSLLIGLAATQRWASFEDLWLRSRVDELWQEEQWGEDEEATKAAETKRTDFLHAGRVWAFLHGL